MANLIHLVRHGEVDNPKHVVYGRLPGYGLSERGLEQAQDAARYLASPPIVAVWSSPLERAIETAYEIARRHQLPVKVDDALTEWKMADEWEGLVWEDLPEARPGQLEAYLDKPWDLAFAAESLETCARRVGAVVRRLDEMYRDGEVVVVGHQDPTQAARLLLTGKTLADQHTGKPLHATVLSLRAGTPWVELARYDPENQVQFPPG